jgi:hypothetical protein
MYLNIMYVCVFAQNRNILWAYQFFEIWNLIVWMNEWMKERMNERMDG